ncbi:M81 family metallopeptidase [Neobacillus terrae]|uniref:M81 family metallopeptidase n=1 Tax=Neobacillus terrae TaxID=3034837 RepID=UPI00140E7325|nr:M81 family metallopeptidase [Neobacillus terrae]NHM31312.1 M81 family metallopeptidase [Neobacillus terrae]
MKIIIGGIAHETNTFSNVKTDEESFRLWGWELGEEIVAQNRKVRNFIGGMIDRAEELKIDIIPTFSTFAYPAGIITAATYASLINELISQINKAEGYDAIVLSLHGAGVSECSEDLEGSILKEVRSVVGYDIPIIITLDLHANMTKTMVEEATLILGNHLYPHTDSYEIGREAVEYAQKIVEDGLQPTMHLTTLPMIIPTSTTNLSPANDVNHLCYNWESDDHVIDCTFYHAFPYTNISELGVAVLATTINDPNLAKQAADEVAAYVWEQRDNFLIKHPSPKEGIALAIQHEGLPVVINETSDNPGGGTPGDGTYLLKALLDEQAEKSCFGFIYDPEVVDLAFKAGVGSWIVVELGGKTDELHGDSIPLTAYIKSLTDGKFVQSSPMGRGAHVNLGRSVRLQCNNVDIIVCSVKAQTLDEQIFLLHGIDVATYKIVGLKSSQHFRAGFEPISSKIITVDSPGLTTLDFTSFDYTNLNTEVYPLQQVKASS